MFGVHGVITFARGRPERIDVGDLDLSAAIAEHPGLLQRMRDDRNRVALDADHAGELLLRHRQRLSVPKVSRAQQPARQPLFDRMRGVAGGGLLCLGKQRLLMARE